MPLFKAKLPELSNFDREVLPDTITIGMSAYGNLATTANALGALFQSAAGNFELILVDDCSPDQGETKKLFMEVQQQHERTRVFSFTENLEYSGSLNAILSHAQGEWILFLSNDIFVTPSYLRELLLVAETASNPGIIRGVSNFVDNGLATHNIAEYSAIEDYASLFRVAEKIEAANHGKYLNDAYLIGDAFMVNRSVIEKIGTFDNLFFGYFADQDFGIRARVAGFELLLAQGAFAFHQRAANFDYLPQAQRDKKLKMRWARVYENWARFKLKYSLPVSEPYTSINAIPWDVLSSAPFNPEHDFSNPQSYAKFEQPKSNTSI